MDQASSSTRSPNSEVLNIPKYYLFKDESNPDVDYTLFKIRVDSDEGRAYEKLSNDAEREQYMRQHAHEKMGYVSAQWHFYEDKIDGKKYLIRIGSAEGNELEILMGDSDDEMEEGSEKMEAVLRYFKEHSHMTEEIERRTSCALK